MLLGGERAATGSAQRAPQEPSWFRRGWQVAGGLVVLHLLHRCSRWGTKIGRRRWSAAQQLARTRAIAARTQATLTLPHSTISAAGHLLHTRLLFFFLCPARSLPISCLIPSLYTRSLHAHALCPPSTAPSRHLNSLG